MEGERVIKFLEKLKGEISNEDKKTISKAIKIIVDFFSNSTENNNRIS